MDEDTIIEKIRIELEYQIYDCQLVQIINQKISQISERPICIMIFEKSFAIYRAKYQAPFYWTCIYDSLVYQYDFELILQDILAVANMYEDITFRFDYVPHLKALSLPKKNRIFNLYWCLDNNITFDDLFDEMAYPCVLKFYIRCHFPSDTSKEEEIKAYYDNMLTNIKWIKF